MVGLLGVLTAGAAQGYGKASNQEVDTHNAVAIENMRESARDNRELMRQKYENERFDKQVAASNQQAQARMEMENKKYERDREDRKLEKESDREHDLKKLGIQEAGMNKRSLLRQEKTGGGSEKELKKQFESNNRRIFDLKKEIQNPVGYNNQEQRQLYQSEIDRLVQQNAQIEQKLGIQPSSSVESKPKFDFVFNPQTGKLEPPQ